MREILFKAKRVDNGEWVFGYLIKKQLHNKFDSPPSLMYEKWFIDKGSDINLFDGIFQQVEVLPETVCQFTGLLDKNGNKIFEGDKVKFKNFRGVNGVKISKYDGWIEGLEGFIMWKNTFGWFLNKDNDHNSKIFKARGKETESRKCNLIITNSNICAFEPEIIGNIHD